MLLGSNPDRVIQKVSTSPEGCQIILMVPDRGSASASYNPYPNMLLRPLVYQGERFALMTQRWRTLQRVAISLARSATSPKPSSPWCDSRKVLS